MAENERVGYGKPPKRTQFRRGQSGNLKGRPKGSKNLANLLAAALAEKIVINENGRIKTITKAEAAIKQLVNKAAAGDLAALRLLATLTSTTENTAPPDSEKPTVTEADQRIMQRLLERLEQSRRSTDESDH